MRRSAKFAIYIAGIFTVMCVSVLLEHAYPDWKWYIGFTIGYFAGATARSRQAWFDR